MMPAMYIRLYSGMPYASCRITASPQPPAWNMPAIVAGKARMDEAKMTGMTPPVFTFRGMCVLDPPYIRRPTTRLAYCTVTRRWPRSMKMIAAMTATNSRISSRMRIRLIWPVLIWPSVAMTARGSAPRCRRR